MVATDASKAMLAVKLCSAQKSFNRCQLMQDDPHNGCKSVVSVCYSNKYQKQNMHQLEINVIISAINNNLSMLHGQFLPLTFHISRTLASTFHTTAEAKNTEHRLFLVDN